MFGYININQKELSEESKKIYQAYYCGLCQKLKTNCGTKGQMLLSYDLTFLIVLLTGLYELENTETEFTCPLHPTKKRTAYINEATEYAADMNLILAYQNLLDDWKDEKSYTKKAFVKILDKDYTRIVSKYPRQVRALEEFMRKTAEAEKILSCDPDIVISEYEDVEKENPRTYCLEEVELNKNYAMVISTSCGLWRYMIGDTVKFTRKNPYKFVITGRTKHFINAFGEELIVDNAEKGLAKACAETGAQVSEYSAAPVFMDANAKCRHQWLIEFAKIGIGVSCVVKQFVKNELSNGSLIEINLPNAIPPRETGFLYNQNIQPFNDNMLRPCPMLENPQKLRQLINKTGAKSTNLLQPESAEELCSKCDLYAQNWAPKAKEIWEEQERFHPFTQYYRDTPEGKKEFANK